MLSETIYSRNELIINNKKILLFLIGCFMMKNHPDINKKYKTKQKNKNSNAPNWGFGERSQKNKRKQKNL